jgi:hypothetical protein
MESLVKAGWNGNKLMVTSMLVGVVKIEQVISLEAGVLTMVTRVYLSGSTYPAEGPKPIVFTYKKQ